MKTTPCNVTVRNEAESAPNSFDDYFSYNTALLAEGLYFINFLDATAEEDGLRIIASTST